MVLTHRLWGSRPGARPRLTRTSCTSSELRSWRIRCWPGDSPSPITCRWPCRASGPCPGCSSRCQHYLHPLCPPRDPALALAPAPGLVLAQHLQITAGLTVRPAVHSPAGGRGGRGELLASGQQCRAELAAIVVNAVSPAALSPDATRRGFWGWPLGGLPRAVVAGANTGCIFSSCVFLPVCRHGRAQHAPPRTLRCAPGDAGPAPRRPSEALA